MPENWDDVNLGNPSNSRRDAEERSDAKVTHADHPNLQIGVGAKGGADDLFDDTVRAAAEKDERGRSAAAGGAGPAVVVGGNPPAAPVAGPPAHGQFDTHGETVRDPELE